MSGQAHFEVYDAGDGWRWRLRAANGKIVASGESYPDRDGAEAGIVDALAAAMSAGRQGEIYVPDIQIELVEPATVPEP